MTLEAQLCVDQAWDHPRRHPGAGPSVLGFEVGLGLRGLLQDRLASKGLLSLTAGFRWRGRRWVGLASSLLLRPLGMVAAPGTVGRSLVSRVSPVKEQKGNLHASFVTQTRGREVKK